MEGQTRYDFEKVLDFCHIGSLQHSECGISAIPVIHGRTDYWARLLPFLALWSTAVMAAGRQCTPAINPENPGISAENYCYFPTTERFLNKLSQPSTYLDNRTLWTCFFFFICDFALMFWLLPSSLLLPTYRIWSHLRVVLFLWCCFKHEFHFSFTCGWASDSNSRSMTLSVCSCGELQKQNS